MHSLQRIRINLWADKPQIINRILTGSNSYLGYKWRVETLEKYKILIVEDEREIREMISLILLRQGYTLRSVGSSEMARNCLATETYDLIVLDWMLPEESGIDFLNFVRQKMSSNGPPVLMVTAKADPEDIVWGLDAGADDYVTKPFDTRVFLSRIASLLRRLRQPNLHSQEEMQFGSLKVSKKTMLVYLDNQQIDLTGTEFRLLWVLLTSPNVVLTREKILAQMQGSEVNVIGRTVDTHLFSLRKKLMPWSDSILTVRGVGYRFTPGS